MSGARAIFLLGVAAGIGAVIIRLTAADRSMSRVPVADTDFTDLNDAGREELEKLYDQLKAGRKEEAETGPMPEEQMSPDDRALAFLCRPPVDPAPRWNWSSRQSVAIKVNVVRTSARITTICVTTRRRRKIMA